MNTKSSIKSIVKSILYFIQAYYHLFLYFYLFIYLSGQLLDWENERVVKQIYKRNESGIIEGCEGKAYKNKHSQVLFIAHGFNSSPAVFYETYKALRKEDLSDIYLPLLPFHGRDLKTLSALNNQVVSDFLEKEINQVAREYNRVIVWAFSYSATLIMKLHKEDKLPKNVNLILQAPSVHITSNTKSRRAFNWFYTCWRKYTNHTQLGCGFPSLSSLPSTSAHVTFLYNQKTMLYVAIPALGTVYQIDEPALLSTISMPTLLLMAEDDNRIDEKKIREICKKNANIVYCSFPHGKHLMHMAEPKEKILTMLKRLLQISGAFSIESLQSCCL